MREKGYLLEIRQRETHMMAQAEIQGAQKEQKRPKSARKAPVPSKAMTVVCQAERKHGESRENKENVL